MPVPSAFETASFAANCFARNVTFFSSISELNTSNSLRDNILSANFSREPNFLILSTSTISVPIPKIIFLLL